MVLMTQPNILVKILKWKFSFKMSDTALKLDKVFVKHYAPNHMLAPEDNICIIKTLKDLSKVNQVIYYIYKFQRGLREIFLSFQGDLWKQVENI